MKMKQILVLTTMDGCFDEGGSIFEMKNF